jgi:uncharacterized protein (TIGR02466 family)
MIESPTARFESGEVLRLFPTFVWKARLAPEVHRPIDDAILGKLRELQPEAGVPPGALWQSSHGLHQLEAFAGLIQAIGAAVARVADFLELGAADHEITGCWANVAPPGASHRTHSHPNNFLSGVYYVRLPEGADTINFHDPRPQTGILRPPVTALTAYNTDQVVVKVAPGTLLVFPAWLPHSVDPNASGANRISVSFNVMFRDFAATLAKPLWGEP